MDRTAQWLVMLWLLWLGPSVSGSSRPERPNIVIIVADDLGWNDVSFHGSNQIPTPNIDALAYDGIILNRHYVPPLCTPSRASLMTGKHPMNIGMQDHVIISDEPWGLGLDQKLMPEYFREAGYRTHLVGKWHLGFFRRAYTPTYRGFDSHFGYLGPYIDYWDHSLQMNETSARGLDMRRNADVNYAANGTYATDLFNDEAVRIIRSHNDTRPLFLVLTHLAPHTGNEDDPMQAPEDEIAKFSYIQDPKRRTLAAMISRIDRGVERVYHTLEERSMLNNTIILFYADNGAPTVGIHANSGSNYPLRGQKESPWEGAVRGAALIWSPLLPRKGVVSNQWFHVSDWLPTLGQAAGIKVRSTGSPIDGQNQWQTLQSSSAAGRTVVMNNAEETFEYSSYIKRGWKYVNGTVFEAYDGWLGRLSNGDRVTDQDYYDRLTAPGSIGASLRLTRSNAENVRSSATVQCSDELAGNPCEPLKSACLFNIVEDPCERNNQAREFPALLAELESDINNYRNRGVPSRRKPSDGRSDPARHNFTWTWWLDEEIPQRPPNGLQHLGVVSDQTIHVSDWLPTLSAAAGIDSVPSGSAIDGQNQWNTLLTEAANGRSVVMHNADEKFVYSSYMKHGWKYVNGTCFGGVYDGWLGDLLHSDQLTEGDYYSQLTSAETIGATMNLSETQVLPIRQAATIACPKDVPEVSCEPLKRPCLFNIIEDPCERQNLADQYPDVLNDLQADVALYRRNSVRPRNQPPDGLSDPSLYNNTWTWWQDELDAKDEFSHHILYLAAAIEILVILLLIWWGQKYFLRQRKK
uniref:Sulfatase N-terminal domain-containing protein n=1 Tax=Anopheles farauti TaxID=69004 RepID=A0A182Q886_9DIPT